MTKNNFLLLLIFFVLLVFRIIVFPLNTNDTDESANITTPIRLKILSFYRRNFPSPIDGILSGIVIGDKSLLTKEFWNKLKDSGTLHIMVASGTNVALIAGAVLPLLLLFIKRRKAILLLYLIIWFYCLLSGFSPPIIRASLMTSLIYLGQLFGRPSSQGRILFITAGIMILISPLLIIDLGFQLSFCATAGLIFLMPLLKRLGQIGQIRPIGQIFQGETFSSTLSAQLATLPIILLTFGKTNPLSIVANLLILWTIPIILQIGIVGGVIGLIWEQLGVWISYLAYPLMWYLEKVVNLF